jgi:hypothetical protein
VSPTLACSIELSLPRLLVAKQALLAERSRDERNALEAAVFAKPNEYAFMRRPTFPNHGNIAI